MPLTPNEQLELDKLERDQRQQAWTKQAAEEGLGTRLAIGAMSSGEKMLRALGGRRIAEAAGLRPEELEAAKEGAGTAGTIGELGTDIALTAIPAVGIASRIGGTAARLLPRALAQAGAGAIVSGATTPGDLEERAKAAAFGAAGGAGGEIVGTGLAKFATPSARTIAARKMLAEDVPLTPGQYMGGITQGVENFAAKIPGAGELVKLQQREATKGWQQGVFNEVRASGSPEIKESGHAGYLKLKDSFDEAYDDLLHKKTITHLPNLLTEVKDIQRMYRPDLTREGNELLGKKLQSTLENMPSGRLSGSRQRQLERELASEAAEGYKTGNGVLGDVFNDILDTVKASRNESLGGADAAKLVKLDENYGKFKAIQRAMAKDSEGIFTPDQLLTASKTGAGRHLKAAGIAPLQTEAAQAGEVLGRRPELGSAITQGLIGGGALAGGLAYDPTTTGGAALLTTGALLARRPLVKTLSLMGRGSEALARRVPEQVPRIAGQFIGREAGQPRQGLTDAEAAELAQLEAAAAQK